MTIYVGNLSYRAAEEMIEEAQEDTAITELDGAEWMGRHLRVNKAKPREESNQPSGGSGGIRRNEY